MFNFKKTASLLVAFLLSFGVVATGCAKNTESSTSDADATSGAETTKAADSSSKAADSGKVEEIKAYWLAPQCKDLPAVQDAVNAITEKEIGVKLNITYLDWDSYQDKTALMLQSGEDFDLLFTAGWNKFSTFVGQGAFQPVDDLLAEYGKDISKNIDPMYLKAAPIGGKLYSIPTNKDYGANVGLIINKALADKYKMDFSKVKKPSDFLPFFQTIKDKEPSITPFAGYKGNNIFSLVTRPKYDIIGGSVDMIGVPRTGSTKVTYVFDDPEILEVADVANQCYTKGYTNADIATSKSVADYKNNGTAFCWTESLKPGKAEEMTTQLGYEVIQVNAHGDAEVTTSSTSDLTGSMLSIPAASKKAASSMKFINELFANTEVQNLLAWGIKDKHYAVEADGRITYPAGVTADTSGYKGIYQWAMGGNQLTDLLWNTENLDKWEKMTAFNKSSAPNDLIGFSVDTSKIQNELAALSNCVTQYFVPVECGTVTFAEVKDKLEKDMKTAGSETVIKDVQAQIDAFLAAKK